VHQHHTDAVRVRQDLRRPPRLRINGCAPAPIVEGAGPPVIQGRSRRRRRRRATAPRRPPSA
jgi:hypothetical protein